MMATGRRRYAVWAQMTGFGLGGIFDGFVLHQVLQWHHLFGEPGPDPAHILWDGLFNLAMGLALLVGLGGMWRARQELARITGRCILGLVLMGFGLWHVVDAVLVHWILGLHRIRPAAEMPLVWDVFWLVSFGILPMLIGNLLRAIPER
jgi:uncharacterized membrane protein